MFWKVLVLWTVLCLAGFVGGDDDFDFLYWYPGRRKLASIYSDEDEDNNPQGEYVYDDATQTTPEYGFGNGEESAEVSAEADYDFGNEVESAEVPAETDYDVANRRKAGEASAEDDYDSDNGVESAEESAEVSAEVSAEASVEASAEADNDVANRRKAGEASAEDDYDSDNEVEPAEASVEGDYDSGNVVDPAEADYDSGNMVDPAEASAEAENKEKKLRMYGNTFLEKPNPFLDNYLAYTRLNLYNRHKRVQVIKASEWFQNFDYNRDLVILMHGGSGDVDYVEDFFNTMAFALLQSADYNVVGIDWRHFYMKERDVFDAERNVEELLKIGHILHSVIERALSPKSLKTTPRTIYIGHGLGNVPVVVQSVTYGYAFDVVYGLTPRYDLGSHNYLKLTQLHGKLVNLLPMNLYQNSLAHRNFYPVYNDEFYLKGATVFLAYQVLSTAILFGNITARFCESEEAYNRGYCSRLTEIPLWYRSMSIDEKIPQGSYFFELPAPKLRHCCEGQTFVVEKHN